MKKALPNGGDVAILVGSLTATNVIQRTQGFMQAIKGSKIKVIATDNDNGVAATAASNADTIRMEMRRYLEPIPDLSSVRSARSAGVPGGLSGLSKAVPESSWTIRSATVAL